MVILNIMSFIDKVIGKINSIQSNDDVSQFGLQYNATSTTTNGISSITFTSFFVNKDNIKQLCNIILAKIQELNRTLNSTLQNLPDQEKPDLVDTYANLLAHFAIFKEVFILHAFNQLVERENIIKNEISELNKILQINQENNNKPLKEQLEALKANLQTVTHTKKTLEEKDKTLQEILQVTASILDDTVVKSVEEVKK